MRTREQKVKIGYRVGTLTVFERTRQHKNGYSVWKCRCDCGGEIELDTRCLQRETVSDCGCKTAVRPGMLDLTGQRFGKLVCVGLHDQKDKTGNTLWVCKCDCGNTCIAAVNQLRAGYKKSCGCLGHPKPKDYVGKRFNKLTVTEYAGKRAGVHRWKCLCDCGRETVVGQTLLQSGKTKSCGCLSRSKKTKLRDNPFYEGFADGANVGIVAAIAASSPEEDSTDGIYKNADGTWSVQIRFNEKIYYLGSFTDIRYAMLAGKRGEEVFKGFLDWYYSIYLQQVQEVRRA